MIKNTLKKLNCLVYMLAFSAGIIFCLCGFLFEKRLPENVTVDGVQVGGMSKTEAAYILREKTADYLKGQTLEVRANQSVYRFTYPEINFKDNLYYLLSSVQRGCEYTSEKSYYLCGLNEIAANICANESRSVIEPYADFCALGDPFKYHEGEDGLQANKSKLVSDIKRSLAKNFQPVSVSFKRLKRKTTLSEVKQNTRLLTGYTTYFDGSNINRSSNIRLAAGKLNGCVIGAGQTLSFNDIVGERLKSRGFLSAKIIENGEFVEGVGGGVCQVSTTLYNAALLSGLKIEEYHPHSLAVGYVPPSRDAMVSGAAFDLKIKNTTKTPVYIRAKTLNGSVSFYIYGAEDGAKYSVLSTVTGNIPAPEETTLDSAKAREGKDGLTSEGYLVVLRDGYEKRVLLRRDKYLPVKKIKYGGERQNGQNSKNGQSVEGGAAGEAQDGKGVKDNATDTPQSTVLQNLKTLFLTSEEDLRGLKHGLKHDLNHGKNSKK